MKDTTKYFHILDQIDEIVLRIKQLADEQRLVTDEIKDNRLQHELVRLLEQRDKLLHEAQIIFGKD